LNSLRNKIRSQISIGNTKGNVGTDRYINKNLKCKSGVNLKFKKFNNRIKSSTPIFNDLKNVNKFI